MSAWTVIVVSMHDSEAVARARAADLHRKGHRVGVMRTSDFNSYHPDLRVRTAARWLVYEEKQT